MKGGQVVLQMQVKTEEIPLAIAAIFSGCLTEEEVRAQISLPKILESLGVLQ